MIKGTNTHDYMYTPFVISEFKTGLFRYLEPWISPRDSFSESRNVYVNRGRVLSREGLELLGQRFYSNRVTSTALAHTSTLQGAINGTVEIEGPTFSYRENADGTFRKVSGTESLNITYNRTTKTLQITFPTAASRTFFISYQAYGTPIRAIIPFADQDSQSYGHILVDDRGLCVYLNGRRVPGIYVDQLGALLKGKQRNFTFTIPWDFDVSSLSVTFKIAGNTSTIAYNNGFKPSGDVASLTYNPTLKSITGTLSKDPQEGDWVRFSLYPNSVMRGSGNLVSWDTSRNYIAIANGVERVLFFDIGKHTLSKPFMPITEEALWKSENQIAKAQKVKFYKNRLILLDVEIENAGGQNGRWKQSVRWSTPFLDQSGIFSHWNFVADKPYGGEYSPDTNSTVIGCGAVRDKLVVWYTEDVYTMEPTGVSQVPFVFNKINNSKFATCPFTTTDLDTSTQIFGSRGYLQSEGVSVSRLDLAIPDYYETIDFTHRNRISSYRFSGEDNRICTLFPSYRSPNGECDRMLVYNFVEDTFSEYSWGSPKLSCLGAIRAEKVTTWGDMKNYKFRPDVASFTFASFFTRISERIPVAGGMQGQIYAMRGYTDWNTTTAQPDPIEWSFKTCRFGPFIEEGLASNFAYVDIYFEGFGEEEPCSVVLEIYADGKASPTKSVDFILSARSKVQTFRRVQIQVAAQFIEMKFKSDPALPYRSPLKLLGMILWAERGGDIRNIGKLL